MLPLGNLTYLMVLNKVEFFLHFFSIYIQDDLLQCVEQQGFDWHIGNVFIGSLAYTDGSYDQLLPIKHSNYLFVKVL